jgi:hypothetical protein
VREHAVLTRPPEQLHVHPWSTVMRLSTLDGVLWFKATRPELHRFEPRLAEILAATRPDRVAELVAIDAVRGWMLMRHAGTRLRELAEPFNLHRWQEILPRYADLQIAVTPKVEELLALGVPAGSSLPRAGRHTCASCTPACRRRSPLATRPATR